MSDNFAALKREQHKKSLVKAFERYKAGKPSQIYQEIFAFAQMKLNRLEIDPGFRDMGSINTMDDHAQLVTIGVMKGLETFEGDGDAFYSYVHKICFNQRNDFQRELISQKNNKLSLTVPFRDELGGHDKTGEQQDNPAMFSSGGYEGLLMGIPKGIQGIDRMICCHLLAGLRQAEIAEVMNITTKAIERRIAKMRVRSVAERTAEKAASFAYWAKASRTNKSPSS